MTVSVRAAGSFAREIERAWRLRQDGEGEEEWDEDEGWDDEEEEEWDEDEADDWDVDLDEDYEKGPRRHPHEWH